MKETPQNKELLLNLNMWSVHVPHVISFLSILSFFTIQALCCHFRRSSAALFRTKLIIVFQYCSHLGLCFSPFHQATGTGEAVTGNCPVCTPDGQQEYKTTGFSESPIHQLLQRVTTHLPHDMRHWVTATASLQWRGNSSSRPLQIDRRRNSGLWTLGRGSTKLWCTVLCFSVGFGITKHDKYCSCIVVSSLIPEKEECVAPAFIYTSSHWIFVNLSHCLHTSLKGRRSVSVPL